MEPFKLRYREAVAVKTKDYHRIDIGTDGFAMVNLDSQGVPRLISTHTHTRKPLSMVLVAAAIDDWMENRREDAAVKAGIQAAIDDAVRTGVAPAAGCAGEYMDKAKRSLTSEWEMLDEWMLNGRSLEDLAKDKEIAAERAKARYALAQANSVQAHGLEEWGQLTESGKEQLAALAEGVLARNRELAAAQAKISESDCPIYVGTSEGMIPVFADAYQRNGCVDLIDLDHFGASSQTDGLDAVQPWGDPRRMYGLIRSKVEDFRSKVEDFRKGGLRCSRLGALVSPQSWKALYLYVKAEAKAKDGHVNIKLPTQAEEDVFKSVAARWEDSLDGAVARVDNHQHGPVQQRPAFAVGDQVMLRLSLAEEQRCVIRCFEERTRSWCVDVVASDGTILRTWAFDDDPGPLIQSAPRSLIQSARKVDPIPLKEPVAPRLLERGPKVYCQGEDMP